MEKLTDMPFYLTDTRDGKGIFGDPYPVSGARVTFNPEKMFEARERQLGQAVPHVLKGNEGLVVYEDPKEVQLWPCRLWEVDDLAGVVRLRPGNKWVRCRALTVRKELPGWLVMGSHGDIVAQVIEQAHSLTSDHVSAIAESSGDEARRIQAVVWRRLRDIGSLRPIGPGLSAVHEAVEDAARRTSPELFGWNEKYDAEEIIDASWLEANDAAVAAALAVGIPEMIDQAEYEQLTRRWIDVLGYPRAAE